MERFIKDKMSIEDNSEDYKDYEVFVIDKIQRLYDMERVMLDNQCYEAIRDIRSFQNSLYGNLQFWYLRESPVTERLIKKSNNILYRRKK